MNKNVLLLFLNQLALLRPLAHGRGRRPPRQAFSLHIPRVSRAELAANATLRSGHHAFVLTADETLPLGAGVESWSSQSEPQESSSEQQVADPGGVHARAEGAEPAPAAKRPRVSDDASTEPAQIAAGGAAAGAAASPRPMHAPAVVSLW